MTYHVVPTIFESFNARALRPSQVAATFVPPPQFRDLCKRRHTEIIGPRGSGKTTLLKMLQPPALEAWQHPAADEFRNAIDFVGVFVAADRSWGAQVDALGFGKLQPECHQLLGRAAFTTHVLRAVVIAMLQQTSDTLPEGWRAFRRVAMSEMQEVDLVRGLLDPWHIRPAIPSLLALKHALTARLSLIRELANKEAIADPSGWEGRLSGDTFLNIHFLQAASLAAELFDDLVRGDEAKWALLCDELELAPAWIRQELVGSLRSTDDRFLFKLALSPFTHDPRPETSGFNSSPDQDYDEIVLWYPEKHKGYPFCAALWEGMLASHKIPPITPKEMLGVSYFETAVEDWINRGTAYAPGSRLSKRFIDLAKDDITFKEYLNRRRIDPEHLNLLSGTERASEVRKIAPLIPVRQYYRAAAKSEKGFRARSRKSLALYAGAESLFAITEGNPRWFIAIMDRLLDRNLGPDGKPRKIPDFIQANEIERAAQRFSAMLRTIPIQPDALIHRKRGLLSLLNALGEWFHKQIVTNDFTPEPPGTITVDASVSDNLHIMVGQALNTGALILVPDESSQTVVRSLRGKRFRMSYLLAAKYGLPLRLGRDVSLLRALGEAGYVTTSNEQLTLDGNR